LKIPEIKDYQKRQLLGISNTKPKYLCAPKMVDLAFIDPEI